MISRQNDHFFGHASEARSTKIRHGCRSQKVNPLLRQVRGQIMNTGTSNRTLLPRSRPRFIIHIRYCAMKPPGMIASRLYSTHVRDGPEQLIKMSQLGMELIRFALQLGQLPPDMRLTKLPSAFTQSDPSSSSFPGADCPAAGSPSPSGPLPSAIPSPGQKEGP